MGLLDSIFGVEKKKRNLNKKTYKDDNITISIEEVLQHYYNKEDIQRLCKKAKLHHRGVKNELIQRLIEDSDYEISDYLHFMTVDGLKNLCEDMNEYRTGTKPELIKRIKPHISGKISKEEKHDTRNNILEDNYEEVDISYEQESRAIIDSNINKIIEILNDWYPDARYPNESGYQAELYQYFKYNHDYRLRREAGQSRADLLIDNDIAIEIKKNPNSTSYQRLHTQLVMQKKEFGFSIGLIFDVKNRDAYENFLELMEDYNDIFIIKK